MQQLRMEIDMLNRELNGQPAGAENLMPATGVTTTPTGYTLDMMDSVPQQAKYVVQPAVQVAAVPTAQARQPTALEQKQAAVDAVVNDQFDSALPLVGFAGQAAGWLVKIGNRLFTPVTPPSDVNLVRSGLLPPQYLLRTLPGEA